MFLASIKHEYLHLLNPSFHQVFNLQTVYLGTANKKFQTLYVNCYSLCYDVYIIYVCVSYIIITSLLQFTPPTS